MCFLTRFGNNSVRGEDFHKLYKIDLQKTRRFDIGKYFGAFGNITEHFLHQKIRQIIVFKFSYLDLATTASGAKILILYKGVSGSSSVGNLRPMTRNSRNGPFAFIFT